MRRVSAGACADAFHVRILNQSYVQQAAAHAAAVRSSRTNGALAGFYIV